MRPFRASPPRAVAIATGSAIVVASLAVFYLSIPEPDQETPGSWTVTVYYTAVESLHSGTTTSVAGCPSLDCEWGQDDLGVYPESFVEAVQSEGTGLTRAGEYLNWSYDTGFWLDDAPRDTAGGVLVPFQSAAADPEVLPRGTRFAITECGHDEGGEEIDPAVCEQLRAADWSVSDEFTPGLGGEQHVDVYIGEETTTDFVDGPWYVTLEEATLRVGSSASDDASR